MIFVKVPASVYIATPVPSASIDVTVVVINGITPDQY